MSDVLGEGGEVISSSQREYPEHLVGERMQPMLGIILSVHPSDDKDNSVAKSSQLSRGTRHECTVLAGSDPYHPDVPLYNVVIPPERHSGIDNFEEDLPRGCSNQLMDESTFNSDLSKIDYGKLDGEWCVVGFLNGSIRHPYIQRWWPHPSNYFDPATSGVAHQGQALVQADVKKNRFRVYRRINGTSFTVNREGSVYVDTTQAGRTASIQQGKQSTKQFDKGGHGQFDIKRSAQLEINWNLKKNKGPQIGAGSSSAKQIHDTDLPHPDQPVTGVPEPRATKRTILRGKEFDLLFKTSSLSVYCENTIDLEGGKKGEYSALAEDQITLAVQPKGGTATVLVINKDTLTATTTDGSTMTVGNDQAAMATKSGAQISAKGGAVSVTGPDGVSVGAPVSLGGPTAIHPAIKGDVFMVALSAVCVAWGKLNTKLGTALAPVVDEATALTAAIAAFELLATSPDPITNYLTQQVKVA